MPIYWLSEREISFPHPEEANEYGILAAGGDLSIERLLLAYQHGIFPWFNPEDPILWWSPNPRFILLPDELKVAKSMRSSFNQGKFAISIDYDFEAIIDGCAVLPRKGQDGDSWITDDMKQAYLNLHDAGFAHSVEVWQDQEIVGGLYGVAMGNVFFGESMFAKANNASKYGFISLVKLLTERGFQLIDCQQQTKHLASMGARPIERKLFLAALDEQIEFVAPTPEWKTWDIPQKGVWHLPEELGGK